MFLLVEISQFQQQEAKWDFWKWKMKLDSFREEMLAFWVTGLFADGGSSWKVIKVINVILQSYLFSLGWREL